MRCTWSDSSHEISNDGEGTNADTTEGGSNRDIFVKSLLNVGVSETLNTHVLVLQLLGNISSWASADLNPGLGEQGAGGKDESNVQNNVEWVVENVHDCSWRWDVVSETSDRDWVAAHLNFLPLAEDSDKDVASEFLEEELGEEVEIGDKGGLENDWDVGGVEELDWVGLLVASNFLTLDGDIDSESLFEFWKNKAKEATRSMYLEVDDD